MKSQTEIKQPLSALLTLKKVMSLRDDIEIALLFGSRARGDSHEHSDWDIAIQFKDNTDGWHNLGAQEEVRHLLAKALAVNNDQIDLVDLYRGGLGINASIVEEGIPIAGENSLALPHYYNRVWANLEDYYWNLKHVS